MSLEDLQLGPLNLSNQLDEKDWLPNLQEDGQMKKNDH